MSGRGGDAKRGAVKTTAGPRLLAILLSAAVLGGTSGALGAAAPLSPQPVSPTRAATPPSLDAPGGRLRNPRPAPMLAPAATDNYAGSGLSWTI